MNMRESWSTGEQLTAEAFPVYRDDQREIRGRDSPGIDTLGLEVKETDSFLFWLMMEQMEPLLDFFQTFDEDFAILWGVETNAQIADELRLVMLCGFKEKG